MLLDIIKVTPDDNLHLDLVFENGERRRFDMRPLLEVKPWNRLANSPLLFASVAIQHGTVAWPNGIDIAPETLYLDSVPIS